VELDNVHAEMKSVTNRCVVAIVGLPLLCMGSKDLLISLTPSLPRWLLQAGNP
jgi:hypothetical protein